MIHPDFPEFTTPCGVAAKWWSEHLGQINELTPDETLRLQELLNDQIGAAWCAGARLSDWPEDVPEVKLLAFAAPNDFLLEVRRKWFAQTGVLLGMQTGNMCIEMTVGFERVWLRTENEEKILWEKNKQ